jgi:hypothetical protein
VADRLGIAPRELEASVEGIPKNGNSKVLKACTSDVGRLSRKYRHIVAVLDGDKLDRALRLRPSYCKSEARAAFRTVAPHPCLDLVVLDRNIETLLETLGRLDPVLAPQVNEALDKDRNARDIVFRRAARGSNPTLRAALCQEVKSFARLVAKIAGWLEEGDSTP